MPEETREDEIQIIFKYKNPKVRTNSISILIIELQFKVWILKKKNWGLGFSIMCILPRPSPSSDKLFLSFAKAIVTYVERPHITVIAKMSIQKTRIRDMLLMRTFLASRFDWTARRHIKAQKVGSYRSRKKFKSSTWYLIVD